MDKLDREYMLWLYEQYVSYLFFAAGKFTASQPEREDIVHDTLLQLMRNIPVLKSLEHKALAGYLYLTVRSVWMDSRSRELPTEDAILEIMAPQNPEDRNLAKWDAETLKAKLGERDWFLLHTKYIIGCSDAEIGGILGCAQASVRTLLTRARRRAKVILDGKENEKP